MGAEGGEGGAGERGRLEALFVGDLAEGEVPRYAVDVSFVGGKGGEVGLEVPLCEGGEGVVVEDDFMIGHGWKLIDVTKYVMLRYTLKIYK